MKKTHQTYNEENISLEALIDYVFKKLPVATENAMENFLDSHQEYADTVDGILDYCTDKNITTKEALMENLRLNKVSFFDRFPHLKASEPTSPALQKKQEVTQKKISWSFLGILLASIILIGLALWYLTNSSEKKQKNDKIEKERLVKKEDAVQPIDEKDSTNLIKPNEKKIIDGQKSKIKNSQNTKKSNSKVQTNLESVRKEIAAVFPLIEQADQQWDETFVMRGNTALDEMKNLLIAKDSTQYALYGVGLHELTKEKPNVNKAIKLLKKVQQREYPDAIWFLFRGYLLTGEIEQAEILYKKMNTDDRTGNYYRQNFFRSLSPATLEFFQSSAN